LDVYEASVELISLYRHDFLNRLQVISGLAQLGKTDRMVDFIRKTGEEVQQMVRLLSCGDPRLALLIYDHFWADPDISLSLQVRGKLSQLSNKTVEAMAGLFDTFHQQVKNSGPCEAMVSVKAEDRPSLTLRLFGLQNMDLLFRTLENVHGSAYLNMETDLAENSLTLFLDKVRLPEER